ncbi:MAG: acyl carrier protein phosphodiesterase [Balneolaceae bacterium]
MNILAHLSLSAGSNDFLIGNAMGDYVKGEQIESFPDEIKKGILFHRKIDNYTDNHPIFKEAVSIFKPSQGHFSGIVVDMIFDHILSRNWLLYHETPLEDYSKDFYKLVSKRLDLIPKKGKVMIYLMIKNNWLPRYATVAGIGISSSFRGMSKRSSYENNLFEAYNDYAKNKDIIGPLFFAFWKDIRIESKKCL